VEITEVRIKLMEEPGERLKAFCSITFDDCFVVRDLKIIEGTSGPFVAMPSRKLTAHCPQCRAKNHLRAAYCNQCGERLKENQAVRDEEGRAKLYADIAHPINSSCREQIQDRVIEAFTEEAESAQEPGYASSYEDLDSRVDIVAGPPSTPPPAEKQAPPTEKEAPPTDNQAPPTEKQAPPIEEPAPPAEKEASPTENQVQPPEKPHGPHTAPARRTPGSRRSSKGSFGAGIFE
jgi:stage V sporulation protein G